MTDALRQIRVLHLVSAGGVTSAVQPSLFMPLLTRLPRQRVKAQVACLSPGAVPSAVLRQNGVPTYDLALSRKRFSPTAFRELVQSTRHFRPDVIQAWGLTAQVISALLRKRCDWKPRLVWSVSDTTPLAKNPGFIDKQKLKYAAKFSTRADRIVYASEAGASQHRRVGFPDGGHETIPPGVDAARFKPDFAARRKLREELKLPGETLVIGMVAPFQVESDHTTLIRAVGELIKTNPHIALVLAGHGVQKGNAPLMALIGGGALSSRVHLLGEWSDINGLYNACDVVCSSAVNDQSRMNVVMAMLCGVPVVATGIGAQGELIGQHGVAIEPGSPAAFIKGLNRIMQLTPEKRTFLAQGARKHALANYVYVRSLQKYLQLYYDLIGRQSLVTKDLPAPEIDASLTVPPALPTEAEMNAAKRKPITVVDLADPDSLESKVAEREPDELPKWRLEQEQERARREAELAAKVAESKSLGDVLEVFESQQVKALASESPMTERARGVADDSEELLPAELLTAEVPVPPRVSNGPSVAKKSAPPSTTAAAQPDAAKQAALKAARMAALQPIAPAPSKAPSPVTRPPATSPMTRPPATVPTEQAKPVESAPLAATDLLKPTESASVATTELSKPTESAPAAATEPSMPAEPAPLVATDLLKPTELVSAATIEPSKPAESMPLAVTGSSATESAPLAGESLLPQMAAAESAAQAAEEPDSAGTQPLETLPEGTLAGLAALKWPMTEDVTSTTADVSSATGKQKVDIASTQPLGTLAQELANAALAGKDLGEVAKPAASKSDVFKLDSSSTQSLELPDDLFLSRHVVETVSPPSLPAAEPPIATGSMTEFGELTLLATGEWQAMQRSDTKPETKTESAKAEAKGDTTKPAASSIATTPEPKADAAKPATNSVAAKPTMKADETKSAATDVATKPGGAATTPEIQSGMKTGDAGSAELSGPETLSLISTPDVSSTDPTVKLALLPDPAIEPKRAANGK